MASVHDFRVCATLEQVRPRRTAPGAAGRPKPDSAPNSRAWCREAGQHAPSVRPKRSKKWRPLFARRSPRVPGNRTRLPRSRRGALPTCASRRREGSVPAWWRWCSPSPSLPRVRPAPPPRGAPLPHPARPTRDNARCVPRRRIIACPGRRLRPPRPVQASAQVADHVSRHLSRRPGLHAAQAGATAPSARPGGLGGRAAHWLPRSAVRRLTALPCAGGLRQSRVRVHPPRVRPDRRGWPPCH